MPHVTGANQWALDVGFAARLTLHQEGYLGAARDETARAVRSQRCPPLARIGSGHDHRRPAAAPPRPGCGPRLRARRRVPGRPPVGVRPDLVARARAAKEALGSRVFVLGHHYQRDEVIQFADVTGDSFKLAREAAARPEAEYIVFCGVHFMAESADILTSDRPAGDPARPRRRLLDGRHGPAATGRGRLGGDGGGRGRRGRRARHLHELQRRHQGVLRPQRRRGLHLVQRRDRPRVGLPAGREGALPPRPAPRPQHRGAQDGARRSTTASSGTRTGPTAGSPPSSSGTPG